MVFVEILAITSDLSLSSSIGLLLFHNILWKNSNEIFGQSNSCDLCALRYVNDFMYPYPLNHYLMTLFNNFLIPEFTLTEKLLFIFL